MIRYNEAAGRVKQELGSISFYDFDGEFPKVIEKIDQMYQSYHKDYVQSAKMITENQYNNYTCKPGYIDGTKQKIVKFDKIFISVEEDSYGESEEKHIAVWGERDILPEEMNTIIDRKCKSEDAAKERDLKELERLKAKYPEGK